MDHTFSCDITSFSGLITYNCLPSWELTYPLKSPFWRWLNPFPVWWDMLISWRVDVLAISPNPSRPCLRCITSFEAAFAGLAVMCHKVNPKASASRNGEKPGDVPSEIWVFPKIRGKPPKLDGENNGKPYFLMDLGGKPHYFWKHPYIGKWWFQVTYLDGPMEKTPDRSDGKKLLKKYVLRKS